MTGDHNFVAKKFRDNFVLCLLLQYFVLEKLRMIGWLKNLSSRYIYVQGRRSVGGKVNQCDFRGFEAFWQYFEAKKSTCVMTRWYWLERRPCICNCRMLKMNIYFSLMMLTRFRNFFLFAAEKTHPFLYLTTNRSLKKD